MSLHYIGNKMKYTTHKLLITFVPNMFQNVPHTGYSKVNYRENITFLNVKKENLQRL